MARQLFERPGLFTAPRCSTVGKQMGQPDIAERYQLSTYDAMIAAAALEARCTTFWSEDMQDGLLIHYSLRIRNPFNLD